MTYLSIIIPAYNEEIRLPNALFELSLFLQYQPFEAEVIIVDNDSDDNTYTISTEFAKEHNNFRVIREKNRGKGAAVRTGMLTANGKYRLFCDVDLAVPINQVIGFFPPHCDSDISIASRESPGAVRYNEPFYRHIMSRLFSFLVKKLLIPRISDTQCGLKCFKDYVAEDIFKYQTISGWSFDLELLFIAIQRNYSICEIPVHWYYKEGSKINPLRDSMNMFTDIFIIRKNFTHRLYDKISYTSK